MSEDGVRDLTPSSGSSSPHSKDLSDNSLLEDWVDFKVLADIDVEIVRIDGSIVRLVKGSTVKLPLPQAKVLESHGIGHILTKVQDDSIDWSFTNILLPEKSESPVPPRGYLEYVQNRYDISEVCPAIGLITGDKFIPISEVFRISNHDILAEFFKTLGYELILKCKGRKSIKAFYDYVDTSKEFALIDSGYTKIVAHDGYSFVVRSLGFNDWDLSAEVRFLKYHCGTCDLVYYKPYSLAGRVHPSTLYTRSKVRSFRKYKRYLAVVKHLLKEGVYNYRNGKFIPLSDRSLALITLEFTIPIELSYSILGYLFDRLEKVKESEDLGFQKFGYISDVHLINRIYHEVYGELVKVFRRAARNTLLDVFSTVVEVEEGYPVSNSKIMLGGDYAIHIWSSDNVSPHIHVHANVLNVLKVDDRFIRFKPELSDWVIDLLKEKWRYYLKKELEKSDIWVWVNPLVFDRDFVVHVGFIELDLSDSSDFCNAGRLLHRFRYIGRNAFLDLNTAFHEGRLYIKDNKVFTSNNEELDWAWLELLAIYQTRHESFGFVHSCKRVLGISEEELRLLRDESKTEFCPICGSKMDLDGLLLLSDLLDAHDRFVFMYYHNGYFRYEFWKKKGKGGDLGE